MKKIVLATGNLKKVREMKDIFASFGIEIIKVADGFDPIEDGKTFEENSFIKAKEAAKMMNMPCLADDSGLEVEALDNRPGIHSSRYESTDEKRINKLLSELKDKTNRKAHFACSMVLVDKNGNKIHSSFGTCEGEIIKELKGTNGFGYDPVFYIPELNKTMAELTMDEKNQISHRSKALKDMLGFVSSL